MIRSNSNLVAKCRRKRLIVTCAVSDIGRNHLLVWSGISLQIQASQHLKCAQTFTSQDLLLLVWDIWLYELMNQPYSTFGLVPSNILNKILNITFKIIYPRSGMPTWYYWTSPILIPMTNTVQGQIIVFYYVRSMHAAPGTNSH